MSQNSEKKKATLIIQKEFLKKIKELTIQKGVPAYEIIDEALECYLKDKKIPKKKKPLSE